MIKNKLEDSVLLLKKLRAEMHDKMDDSQLKNLDLVISQLEVAQSQSQILELLGKALSSIPWIYKIIERLSLLP
ncbi:hypothetical protein ABW490_000140 [Haemophilus influenzae]|jgi:hypothetical protein|nr:MULTISPECIES: hypothetical protein [Haemophilus]EDK10276.1 hypothetical protein CGSHiHH_08562 [Haemophilus influenzae PittHH]AVJ03414.1 hypothetical protein BV131_1125 [Haemophilus influenzae]AVJ05156.1 hypothetical protein BV134_1126 [Haemophilus influenzae]KIP49428.1 hypothetical protein SU59_04005 [Haemophilus influenzae]KMZ23879.1 hypothetical protein ABN54_01475 [Haemophilus influenzae]